jgi:fatty-acyl-CoA synthase
MPPFHTGGWNVLITPFLHHGAYVCLLKKLDPAVALELLQSERCTLFMGVPTILQMMAREAAFEQARFPEMLYLIVGGEPMPLPLIEQWHQKQVPVRQGYGMTEVGPNLTSLHQDDAIRKKGSIGRPNFYVQIQLVDQEGKIQPPGGTPGELWLRGPMVMLGYWNNEKGTQAAFSEDGKWFKTGDELYQDEEGYLYVVDRIKNMYKSGGENIYPAEIERILLQFPRVLEAAVVGIPDEKWGEVGRAFVVDAPEQPVDLEALKAFCQDKLAKFKVPKHFERLEALPKTDSGKINRQFLKKWQP